MIFRPGELASCVGYFSTIIGAVAHKSEAFTGSGGTLAVHQSCAPNPGAAEQAWRSQLRERLERLFRPQFPSCSSRSVQGVMDGSRSSAPRASVPVVGSLAQPWHKAFGHTCLHLAVAPDAAQRVTVST
jgi:hypothetical protein